jgi:molybdate transport repressor ModE-like protein
MSAIPDFESLRLLIEIGATGSITEAARRTGLSQPAASKRFAKLERSMAVPLIDRTPSGSRLTPAGLVVADWAGRVFSTIDQMLEAVESMRTHSPAALHVASSMTIAEHLVPVWLSTMRASQPRLHVALRVTNSQDVQRLVLQGHADIGLVETTSIDPLLDGEVLAHDRLAVVVAPTHGWARRRLPLEPHDLAAAQLVVREPGSGTRETLDRWLASQQPTEPLLELGSNAAVKGAVRAGVGPAVLSVLAVQDELALEQLVEVAVRGIDLSRPLTAVWPRGSHLDEASATLLTVARGQPDAGRLRARATARRHDEVAGTPG